MSLRFPMNSLPPRIFVVFNRILAAQPTWMCGTSNSIRPFVQFVETQKNCVALNFISGFHLNVRPGGFLVLRYGITELRFNCTKRKYKIWNHCGTEIMGATTCQCLNINIQDKPRWLNNWNITIHTKILMGCQRSSSNHQFPFLLGVLYNHTCSYNTYTMKSTITSAISFVKSTCSSFPQGWLNRSIFGSN